MNQASPLKKIAGYQVEQLIGQGSFALVYAAKNTLDLRQPQRALFELIVEGDRLEQTLRESTFKRTAAILEKVSHPSIPQVYSLFENENKLYLVQEFIDGINYAQYLDGKTPPLSTIEIEKVFREVLAGLAQLHRAKIVHQDINPCNLMRRQRDNSTVIVGFSSACDLSTLNVLEADLGDRHIYTPGYGHPAQEESIYNLGFSPSVAKLLQEMLKTEGCQLVDAYDAIKFESQPISLNLAQKSPASLPSKPRTKRDRKQRKRLLWGSLTAALVMGIAGVYFFLPEYTSVLLEKVQAPFAPKCPNYVKNDLNLPLPDRGFAARFYYPETALPGNSTLEVLQDGNLLAQATDDPIAGFIWIKSLAGDSDFPPGNYQLRIIVPESLPYEKEVILDPDFPIAYLGNAAAVQVACALNATAAQ